MTIGTAFRLRKEYTLECNSQEIKIETGLVQCNFLSGDAYLRKTAVHRLSSQQHHWKGIDGGEKQQINSGVWYWKKRYQKKKWV